MLKTCLIFRLSTVTSNGWYKFLQDNILFTANGTGIH